MPNFLVSQIAIFNEKKPRPRRPRRHAECKTNNNVILG